MIKHSLIVLAALTMYAPASAYAQSPLESASNSNEPIEITAQKSLEWHRNKQQYIATGSAIATQGAISIQAQTLTADYKSSDASSIDIWQLTALDDVTIKNEDSTAYGDKAVYNVEIETATLTGSDLKLVSPDQTITATDRFVYKTAQRRATAVGNAKVVRAQDTIEANTIEAVFKEEGQGKGQDAVETLEAKGNVVITTPEEVLTGNYAIFRSSTNKAEITGDVKITRGPNVLEGARAEVDLTTNISKMFGAEETGERVRGIFYPKSEKSSDH